jgi:hypothetical protein
LVELQDVIFEFKDSIDGISEHLIVANASSLVPLAVESFEVSFDGGALDCRFDDIGSMVVNEARQVRIRSNTVSSVIVRGAVDATNLSDVRLKVIPNARASNVSGSVILTRCQGFLYGNPKSPLQIIDYQPGGSSGALHGGRIVETSIPLQNMTAFLSDALELERLEPTVASMRMVRRRGAARDRATADLLFDVIRRKAENAATVNEAAIAAFAARRQGASRFGAERLLLALYGLLGYGRRARTPMAAWMAIIIGVGAWRLRLAVRDPTGSLDGWQSFRSQWGSEAVLTDVVDFVLTLLLLPLSPFREDNVVITRLQGGYLAATRFLLSVTAISVAAAVRARLRLRGKDE